MSTRKAVASWCQRVQLRPTIRVRFGSGVSIPVAITSARCRAMSISILAGEVDLDGADLLLVVLRRPMPPADRDAGDPAGVVDVEAQSQPTADAAFRAPTHLALLRVPTPNRSPMRPRSIPEWPPLTERERSRLV